MSIRVVSLLTVMLHLTACGGIVFEDDPLDLGELTQAGKADSTMLQVPFTIAAAAGKRPGRFEVSLKTNWLLQLKTVQTPDVNNQTTDLQLVARTYKDKFSGLFSKHPRLRVDAGKRSKTIRVTLYNYTSVPAAGTLHITTGSHPAGIDAVFNKPECTACTAGPSNGLREAVVDAIDWAQSSIDGALFGLEDPAVVNALCRAAKRGVAVRLVTDSLSEKPGGSRSYYDAFFGPNGLTTCGAQVEIVRKSGMMHHKALIIDRATPFGALVTGTTNLTTTGLEKSHNHMLFLRGVPGLLDAFHEELSQLYDHCRSAKVGSRQCTECTPGCMQAPTISGPWTVGAGSVDVVFAPSNKVRTENALDRLRGKVVSKKRATLDPSCVGPNAACVCRTSGSGFMCDYCAQGPDGWGLMGQAKRRIYASLFIVTDQCFALALGRAAAAGVETSIIVNYAEAGSPYSRDDYAATMGVSVYHSNWGPIPDACSTGTLSAAQWKADCHGDVMVRNHNKTVVVDDTVFDGSLNISVNGVKANDEATLIIDDVKLAERVSDYIKAEVTLLKSRGVKALQPAVSLCKDIVDNDGDGLVDAADPDCDAGSVN
jgi:phosphatidylserine/phosphatidylglycerophosphate/cardiolipin synthase-like enzyme